jgi:hypothetical protein
MRKKDKTGRNNYQSDSHRAGRKENVDYGN